MDPNVTLSAHPTQPKLNHQVESQRESPDLANMAQGAPSPIPASVIISERKERAEMKSSAPKTFFKQTKNILLQYGYTSNYHYKQTRYTLPVGIFKS